MNADEMRLKSDERSRQMARKKPARTLATAATFTLFVFSSLPAHANAGIPLVMVPPGFTMLLFVPIIAIETYVLKTQLHLRTWRALSVTAGANMLSLLAGWILTVPLTAVDDELVGLGMAMPEKGITYLLALVLFVPFFYLSVWIELRFCRWRLREVGARALRTCVWRANIVSYTMLGVLTLAMLPGVPTTARAHAAKAQADVRALAAAASSYKGHMGHLPAALDDLTRPATNPRGETANAFIEPLPSPPSGWAPYRYESRPDGTFTISGVGDSVTVKAP